ncbi:MAG: hypothetical protein V1838_02705 [Patescibacteria group bacterium]
MKKLFVLLVLLISFAKLANGETEVRQTAKIAPAQADTASCTAIDPNLPPGECNIPNVWLDYLIITKPEIWYNVPDQGYVSMSLYYKDGRPSLRLVDGELLSAGKYSVKLSQPIISGHKIFITLKTERYLSFRWLVIK